MVSSSNGTTGGGMIKRSFPNTLPGQLPNLKDIAGLIQSDQVKNVIIMAGAGISTSAGIPDFRSPETGLYANLEKYNLPYPEAIFDIDYFPTKPQPFYTLAKELYPGNFSPTVTHYFFKLLQDKGILKTVFTQNIDTLESIAGVKEEKLVEAHGSFESAECLACKKQYTKESIKPEIELGKVVYCKMEKCQGNSKALVKPKIVFFGEGLPEKFFDRINDFSICDLLIVLGTSLSVQPFASLINRVPSSTPRLLINLESVGELNSTSPRFLGSKGDGFDFNNSLQRREGARDVRCLMGSDQAVRELCGFLGWENELEELVRRGKKSAEGKKEVEAEVEVKETVEKIEKAPEILETSSEEKTKADEVDDLTEGFKKVSVEKEEKVVSETTQKNDEDEEIEKSATAAKATL